MLGKFDLTGIPPAPRGQPQIEVTFEIDFCAEGREESLRGLSKPGFHSWNYRFFLDILMKVPFFLTLHYIHWVFQYLGRTQEKTILMVPVGCNHRRLYMNLNLNSSSGIVSKLYPVWLCCIVVVYFCLIQTSFANFDPQKQLNKTW